MKSSVVYLYFLCIMIILMIFFTDLITPQGIADGIPYIIVILLADRHEDNRFVFVMAVIDSLLILIGYILSPPGGEAWQAYVNRGLSVFAVWTTAILIHQRKIEGRIKEKAIAEREAALNEIKILRGLIPICASCKRIRDNQGQWHQMEIYIRDHSEATFSHGVCPECFKKLYPELVQNKNK